MLGKPSNIMPITKNGSFIHSITSTTTMYTEEAHRLMGINTHTHTYTQTHRKTQKQLK